MTYDYRTQRRTKMTLRLENGETLAGEFIEARIDPETIPAGKMWYQIRHADDDWSEPASIKRGCVAVNFYGTLISDPAEWFGPGEELDIVEHSYN